MQRSTTSIPTPAHGLPTFSRLSFGGAPVGNLYASVDDASAMAAIRLAWTLGIRHFDTAPYYGYGLSESRLGQALGDLPRAGYTLSTKVGRLLEDRPGQYDQPDGFAVDDRAARFDYSRDGVLRSIESSLQRLRTDHVDVLLLHDIGRLTHGERHVQLLAQALDEALPAMAELRAQGVCRAIGLGVNESEVCEQVLARFRLDVIMLAGRYTLFEQDESRTLMALAQSLGTRILAAGPYNSGLLGHRGKPGRYYNYAPAEPMTVARAQRYYDCCAIFDVEPGAAALQFPLAHPAVATVVCGMRSVAEVESAVERLRAPVPPALWERLREEGLLPRDVPTP